MGSSKIQKSDRNGSQVWLDDMAAHRFDVNDGNLDMVQKWLDHVILGISIGER